MKNRTVLNILICLFLGASISVSCIPGDFPGNLGGMGNTGGNGGDDTDDSGDSGDDGVTDSSDGTSDAIRAKFPSLTDATNIDIYDYMPAGIYEYDFGDRVTLVAKSSDGGGFYIDDVDDEKAHTYRRDIGIPSNFYATDGRSRGYFFDKSLHDWDNAQSKYLDVAWYAVIDEFLTREALFGLENVNVDHAPRAYDVVGGYRYFTLVPNCSLFFQNYLVREEGRSTVAGLDCTIYSVTMEVLNHRLYDMYILDNGVCARVVQYDYQTGGSTVEFSLAYADLNPGDFNSTFTKIHNRHCTDEVVLPGEMIKQYTKCADEWLGSWYSIPAMAVYEGGGTIQRMSVIRTYNWKPYDNVCTIEVLIEGATYDEVARYIDKAEAAAGINQWSADENVMLPDQDYIIYKAWYDPCHPDCPHQLGDTAVGFKYVITYYNGRLDIIFDVTHTAHL